MPALQSEHRENLAALQRKNRYISMDMKLRTRAYSSGKMVLVCEECGWWSPYVYRVVKDLVNLKSAPLHPRLRRSAALAYTKHWWAVQYIQLVNRELRVMKGRNVEVLKVYIETKFEDIVSSVTRYRLYDNVILIALPKPARERK